MEQIKTTRRWRPLPLEWRVEGLARQTAEREAAGMEWRRLQRAQEEYLKWEGLVLWARAIEDTEATFPQWVAKVVEKRCRGFLKFVKDGKGHHTDGPPFVWRHLERWINDRIFGNAWRECWMNAVGYYGARDLTSLRNHAYWEYCERQWKRSKPAAYPTFLEWMKASAQCSDKVLDECEMPPEKRQLIKLTQRVGVRALRKAVDRYLEWEIFAYWTRTALETRSPLPASIKREMKKRCPGFLEAGGRASAARLKEEPHSRFNRLIKWIEDHQFAGAQKHGWFDVLLYQARLHPRHARVIDYWHDWEASRATHAAARYPSFSRWRDAADRYTFQPDAD